MAEKLAYSIKEAAALISVGPDAMRNAIRRGDVRSVHFGGKVLVPADEVRRVLGIEPAEPPSNLQVVEAVAQLLGIDVEQARRAS